MRLLLPAAAVAALALSPVLGFAQSTQAPATEAPGTVAPAPMAPATPPMAAAPDATAPPSGSAPAKPAKHAKRQTLQQHFDAANTTHDGHLTKEQAAAGKWGYVAKHFDAIDKDHKGYVTADDIHAYSHAMHVAKHAKAPAASAN